MIFNLYLGLSLVVGCSLVLGFSLVLAFSLVVGCSKVWALGPVPNRAEAEDWERIDIKWAYWEPTPGTGSGGPRGYSLGDYWTTGGLLGVYWEPTPGTGSGGPGGSSLINPSKNPIMLKHAWGKVCVCVCLFVNYFLTEKKATAGALSAARSLNNCK